MPEYRVRVDDGRYGLGNFQTCEEAVQCCKEQVDALLKNEIAARLAQGADPAAVVDDLFAGEGVAETPFIMSIDKSCRFSAYEYAGERWREWMAAMAR